MEKIYIVICRTRTDILLLLNRKYLAVILEKWLMKKKPISMGGVPGLTAVDPDNCCFLCDVYSTQNGRKIKRTFTTQNFVFDVLPECPVIQILDWWNEYDSSVDFWIPVSSMKINTSNFEWGMIYVIQPGGICYSDTVFLDDFNLEYKIDVWDDDNLIYCWIGNSYGQYRSCNVKARPTDVPLSFRNECKVSLIGRTIHVDSDRAVNVSLYSIDGRVIDGCRNMTQYTVCVDEGLYVLDIFDSETKKRQIKKIYVR